MTMDKKMKNKTKKNKKKQKKEINFKRNLSEYCGFLKKYPSLWIFALIGVIIIELSRLVPKYLFKRLIDDGTSFANGFLSYEAFIAVLLILFGVYVLAAGLDVIFNWLRIHWLNKLNSSIIADIKRKYFNHIISLDHRFHTTHKSGSLISRMIRGSGAAESMTDMLFFQFIPAIVLFIVSAISIAYFSIIPALILLGTIILFIGYGFIIQEIQKKPKKKFNDQQDREKADISDIFTNIESVKYFGKERKIKNNFKKVIFKTKEKALDYWHYFKLFDAGNMFILALGTILILYFPIMQLINGEITVGTLAFIYTVYLGLIGSLFGFVWGMRGFYRAMTDFQQLFDYKEIKKEIKDKKNARKIKIKKGEIEFKNVSFGYNKKRKIFENFNLKIPKNKKVALVGHSGCGKSTLIKLLYRLYDVDKGKVLVDGKNVKNVKQESLRSEMSIVPQEAILFDDTIYNNIKFANPSAKKEQVMQAIKFAQLDRIIKSFPQKEKTIVGERGIKLSGGEKQRVSIARAILADKKILVLDEATSSLDSETEYQIQQDLEGLMEGRTSIIIAHRLSTIMNADIIVVMKNGKIVQKGTHRELITQGGEYQRLWDFQKGGYLE
ncbi:ATP-binding cassette domain-containing protein [Candidatus Pacearchaeota archaeon]|nr:ATP-binding cassette domain-containing protein [Candidatus Pacearchaeota archaeon]